MKRRDYYKTRLARTSVHLSKRCDRLDKVLQTFSGYRLRKVLDIGCGDGDFALALGRCCHADEVYGVDISEEAVEVASKKGVKTFLLDVDEDPLPFEDGSIDGIFCGEVIEHLVDPDHLLDEMYRVFNTSGIAVITTPNLAAWYNRIALLLGFQPFLTDTGFRHYVGKMLKFSDTGGGHLRVFTFKALRETLLLHGFRIVSARGSFSPVTLNSRLLALLYNVTGGLTSIFPSLSAHSVLAVTKGPAGTRSS